jgi:hypothetical protein|tara:strand:+ start:2699 stop:2878 length:180 start_codon:yes stop_codon:yes gene_type:complete
MIEITEINELSDGSCYVILSDELLDILDWSEGDVLNSRLKGNGIIFTKVNDPEKFIPIE